jgi:hypothetical protein
MDDRYDEPDDADDVPYQVWVAWHRDRQAEESANNVISLRDYIAVKKSQP